MTTIIKDTVLIEHMTLAQVIWKKFRRQPAGFIEKVMDLNPGIAEAPFIPLGTELLFPIEELTVKVPTTSVIRLWD